jgi:hypothetical protein
MLAEIFMLKAEAEARAAPSRASDRSEVGAAFVFLLGAMIVGAVRLYI